MNRLLENESELLNLALVCRDSRQKASDILKITDELTAFSFDACVSYVLQAHDNKRDAARLKIQLQGIACLLGAKPSDFASDDDEEEI